ncbi:hypothetical protein [Microbacterium sp. BDGP8]|uniref:hypothetical protein n=1 Tax=Microbacterium sp. BDGP8 TaxID=3035531 RepID=UPI00249EDB9A|nr:hypothetical protein [Microbacterium sp. BDGP8]WHE35137.1 hypothetical protein P6897_10560 [Microbacterium sp. BDGP8]
MKKYLAALLPGIIILFGGLQTALADERIDSAEGSQLLALTGGIIVTFGVPIVEGRWRGLFKTGAAIFAAVATLIIPLILGFTWQSLVIFALAALSALATEIGVQVRSEPLDAGVTADGAAVVTSLHPEPQRLDAHNIR